MKKEQTPTTVIGEYKIIEIIKNRLTPMPGMPVPFGDDISAISMSGEGMTVLKTDMLVAATDVPTGMSLYDAARKAIVMNISDFASKGVKPTAALVALGLPKSLANKKAVTEIADGLNAGAQEYGAYIIGGDTNETSDLIISVSLYGTAYKALALRSGAKAGDIIAITGLFGKTSAGLHLLEGKYEATDKIRGVLVNAVFHPNARLLEGLALLNCDCVSSSMDSSDGLAWSLHELAKASKVGFLLEKLPVAAEVHEFAKTNCLDEADLVFYGGEEYELVLTIKPDKWDKAKAAVETVGGCLLPIGRATAEPEIILDVAGMKRAIESRGWEHFKSPA